MNALRALLACSLLACIPSTAVAAATCRAASGEQLRPLVELYTSEGCDSCPPADRWLAATFADPQQPAIPLAFHVDYWDRLGWKDRFANPRYTERQHAAAAASGATFVYTPQLLLQGRDVRWQDARTKAAVADAARAKPRAAIDVEVQGGVDGVQVVATARLSDARLRKGAEIAVAYVDNGLASDVKAGENRGTRLAHDHVVRAFAMAPTREADGALRLAVTLPLPMERGASPAIVAFVQRPATGEVLQAVSLPVTDCLPR